MAEILYEELDSTNSLTDFVKRFWKFSNPTASVQQYTILPDGYFDLIITVTANKLDSISLFGLWTKEIDVIIPPYTIILGICFKPIAAEYILQKTIADILNEEQKLPINFWGINKMQFENFQKWTEEISNTMLSNLYKRKVIDPRKQTIFNLLFQSNGSIKVQGLSEKLCWSNRQINRYFNGRFGLSLKSYSTILRCAASYTDIREGKFFPKQDFYDQSHFIREIKRHTGFNPKELHQNKNDRFLQFSTLPKV